MATTLSKLSEFVRRVYRQATAADISNEAYLDALADVALAAEELGKQLLGGSHAGSSLSFAPFAAWTPESLIEMIDLARKPCEEATVADALAAVEQLTMGHSSSTDFRYGGFLA